MKSDLLSNELLMRAALLMMLPADIDGASGDGSAADSDGPVLLIFYLCVTEILDGECCLLPSTLLCFFVTRCKRFFCISHCSIGYCCA